MSGVNQQSTEASGASQQATDWNGRSGERWVANQERLDRMLAGYGERTLQAAAAQSGEVVLDVGCGAGATTLELAQTVAPAGRVEGVDISAPLLGRARQRAEAAGLPIHFELSDAGTHPFQESTFDLLFSRFGVMFFEEPVAAFRNLHRALKPGGRVAFVCWQEVARNEWLRLPSSIVRKILPDLPQPDPEAPGPFAFGKRERVEGILRDAGFRDVDVQPFEALLVMGTGPTAEAAIEDAVYQASQVGPLAWMLNDQPPDVVERGLSEVRAAFADKVGPEGVAIGGAAWIVTARKGV